MATENKDFKVKNGLQVGGPTNLVNVSSSSPTNPFLGQLWVEEQNLYAWNSSSWVLVGDGQGGGPIDADLLDGQEGTHYLDWNNTTNKPSPVVGVDLQGEITGAASATLTQLANGQVTIQTTGSAIGRANVFTSSAQPTARRDGDIWINTAASVAPINLNAYALLASPGFTGTPTAPTAASTVNSTQLATTAFVRTQINTVNATNLPIHRGTLVYTSGTTNFVKASYPWLRAIRVRCVGGGGGAGGIAATGGGEQNEAGGGGGGGYAEAVFAASFLVASESVVVGAGGAGATAGNNSGTAGGASTFGTPALITANGGGAGAGSGATSGNAVANGGSGGAASESGSYNAILSNGGSGGHGRTLSAQTLRQNHGGETMLGGRQMGVSTAATNGGASGQNYGTGASGPRNAANQTATAGQAGSAGIVIIELFG